MQSAGGGSMLKPPPVSGESYRIQTGRETRSNYLRAGLLGGVGYTDNLYPGAGGSLKEAILSLQPSIAFDTTSARAHAVLRYDPTFILYEPDEAYSEADHSLDASLTYRITPRFSLDLSDRLLRSSNGFGQIGGGGISGGSDTSTPGVFVLYGQRVTNYAEGGLSYQFSPHGMIGGSGNDSFLNYTQSSQVPGLYNSDSHGGEGYYSARVSASQYVGAIYQYQQTLAYVGDQQYETQTHAIFGFYTLYLSQSFSLSVSGGPQRFLSERTGVPSLGSWTPAVTASVGWQSAYASLAANFTRDVTGGGGLLGTYYTRSTGLSGLWQFSRLWSAGADVSYSINKNAVEGTLLGNPGGHTFATSANASRKLTDRMDAQFTYSRIQARYDGIPVFQSNPSGDRLMLSLNWHLDRPIGR